MGWWNKATSAVRTTVTAVKDVAEDVVDDTVETTKKVTAPVVDFTKDTFETAKHNPIVDGTKKLFTDPVDFARDATRSTLRVAYDGANAILPKGTVPFALKAAEKVVDGVAAPIVAIAGKDSKVGRLANDLSRVDLEGIARTDGLEADWGKLWGTWLFEEKPADLGTWDKTTVNGQPVDRVTVTDPKYTGDLAKQPTQQKALERFLQQHPNPKPGDKLDPPELFEFTGEGTAEGADHPYNALEWFTGSYRTNVECTGIDANGKPQLQFTVENLSHWESATRVPGVGKDAGFNDYLVPDVGRDRGVGLGGDFQQRYVWSQSVDLPNR